MIQQENHPEKQKNIRRRDLLQLGITATAGGALVLALATTGQFEDSDGFSNWDGKPKKKGFENIDKRYAGMAEYLWTQRKEYLEEAISALQYLQREAEQKK